MLRSIQRATTKYWLVPIPELPAVAEIPRLFVDIRVDLSVGRNGVVGQVWADQFGGAHH
jgi:hypothetical protein